MPVSFLEMGSSSLVIPDQEKLRDKPASECNRDGVCNVPCRCLSPVRLNLDDLPSVTLLFFSPFLLFPLFYSGTFQNYILKYSTPDFYTPFTIKFDTI